MPGEIPKDVWPCPLCGEFYGHSNSCPTVLPRLYPTQKELDERLEFEDKYPHLTRWKRA